MAENISDKSKDIQHWGDKDLWKTLYKTWSEDDEWNRSTKAMEIPGVGCVVQVSTQVDDIVAESVTFVPGVRIFETKDDEGKVTARSLIHVESFDKKDSE